MGFKKKKGKKKKPAVNFPKKRYKIDIKLKKKKKFFSLNTIVFSFLRLRSFLQSCNFSFRDDVFLS